MNIHVLGCHGSDGFKRWGADTQICNTCGFLLNGRILVDAGTVASGLSLSEQRQIEHVLLSHLHFDHIKGLPGLADNMSEVTRTPITVAGLPNTIHGLHRHIFNAEVYPDFFSIPSTRNPTLVSRQLKPGTSYSLSDVTVTPVLVNHTVPTTGFIVEDASSAFLYSGDTASTEELWHEARRLPHLKAAFIECSYPNALGDLAALSKHLTPALLAQEIQKLNRSDIAIHVYHLKPVHKELLLDELEQLNLPNLVVVEEGQHITI